MSNVNSSELHPYKLILDEGVYWQIKTGKNLQTE